jgi:hypothetical protein
VIGVDVEANLAMTRKRPNVLNNDPGKGYR